MKDHVEMLVTAVSLDKNEENPRIFLQSRDGSRTLWLGTGSFEAGAIIVEMEKLPCLFTHDSFAGFLTRHGFKVDHLLLHSFAENSCSAELVYRRGIRRFSVGIKPGDGIALALRLGAPLFVSSLEGTMDPDSATTDWDLQKKNFLLVGQGKLNFPYIH